MSEYPYTSPHVHHPQSQVGGNSMAHLPHSVFSAFIVLPFSSASPGVSSQHYLRDELCGPVLSHMVVGTKQVNFRCHHDSEGLQHLGLGAVGSNPS